MLGTNSGLHPLTLAYPTSPYGGASIYGGVMLPASIYNGVPIVATFDAKFIAGTSSGRCAAPVPDSCLDTDIGYYALRATNVPAVPEPGAVTLVLAGVAVVGGVSRRRRSHACAPAP